jgi:hypothetical protein
VSRTQRALALAALASAVVVALPAAARAQVIAGERDRYESPQHFAFELRFGPYRPDVDSEFAGGKGGASPYNSFFGGNRRLMSQIEFDYQIVRHVGSIGLGLGAGYFSETGHNPDEAGMPTADTSTLRLIPISLSAVYRFDLMYERSGIPLVPYGKLGFDYVLWQITNGNGEVAHAAGGTGQGGTWGWHAAVGVSLVLDFFDPVTAHQFDIEMGVNHTHLFAELGHWDVSGLGRAGKLHVGDNTWLAGLMFEF